MKKYYFCLVLILCNVLCAMETQEQGQPLVPIPANAAPNYGLGQHIVNTIIAHEEQRTNAEEAQKRKIRKYAKLKEACTANALGCVTTTTGIGVFFCCPSTTACLVACGGVTQMFWSTLRYACIACDADPLDRYCNLSDD